MVAVRMILHLLDQAHDHAGQSLALLGPALYLGAGHDHPRGIVRHGELHLYIFI